MHETRLDQVATQQLIRALGKGMTVALNAKHNNKINDISFYVNMLKSEVETDPASTAEISFNQLI